MPPSPYSTSDPSSLSAGPSTPFSTNSTPKSSKKPRKSRPNKKVKSDEDEEDGEKETRMRYDWTYSLFETYQEGILENGYKLAIALEILDESTRIGEKILIFSQNLPALDMLEEILKKRAVVMGGGNGAYWEKNRNYLRLDGQTSGADREKLINRFNSETGLHLFLISTRAGSLGINLVSANRCIIIDACWNPCHDAQAVCRVYRYGQQKKTYVYRLIMDNSMERSIFNRQISKHGLQQRVVDDAQVDANISQKELETLLMYDESQDVVNDKWDTVDWKFGDEILDKITEKMSYMFSEKPFLHESLIMESEKALSEEEKREAQLLFEQEKRMENFDPLSNFSIPSSSSIQGSLPFATNYGNNSQWAGPSTQFQPQFNHPLPIRSTPMPHTLRLTVPNYHGGGHTMTSFNNGFGNINNNIPNGQMLPPRDPSAFFGAAKSFTPNFTSSGVCQNVVTDRAMCFPLVGGGGQLRSVPVGSDVQLVVLSNGFFVKLRNGEILKAEGSPFEQRCVELREELVQFTNSQSNRVPEVIDLD
uniref:Helicase C-terminal domain-containing protein n=1 Tax=Caenorhabditis japonica TaxID=281687 RepID=A0A8R1EN60_CAEJA